MKKNYPLFFIAFLFCIPIASAQLMGIADSSTADYPANSWTNLPAYDSVALFIKIKDDSDFDLTFNRGEGFNDRRVSDLLAKRLKHFQIKIIKPAFTHLESPALSRVYRLETNKPEYIDEIIRFFQGFEFIEYAEHVPIYYSTLIPNDFNSQQSPYLYLMNTDLAWNITLGDSSVRIAIVDDAVRTTHEDLLSNVWVNVNEIPGNGIDDDSNGYIDDYKGYDVADSDDDVNPPPWCTNSSFTHGTHVTGIAAASTNNGVGLAGMAFKCRYIPVKSKPDSTSGSSLPCAYLGLEYAIATGADVINMSWGGFYYSATYELLCETAYDSGIVLVAAAGNTGTMDPFYPSCYNGVISVGSTNLNDVASVFSTYGSCIDVMAPGVNIYSCLAGSDQSYGMLSGTSMAAPIVSGICALMLSNNPAMTPDEVEQCLKSACTNINEKNPNKVGMLGSGRVDAFGALTCVEAPPHPVVSGGLGSCCRYVCTGHSLTFQGASMGLNATSWYWQFPGGNPASSTSQNPTVNYPIPGNFDIIVIACNSFGCDTLFLDGAVCVGLPEAFLLAPLSGTVCSGEPNYLSVYFIGDPPFSFAYSNGYYSDTITGIQSHDYWFPVYPTTYSTYMLTFMTDALCDGVVNGSVVLNPVNCGPCANTDFEFGNFSTWLGQLGMCCGMGNFHVGIEGSRMMITSGSGNDPYSGGSIPVVSPFGGNHSLRLGNYYVGAEAEIMQKSFLVTPDNASFSYEFAVVLEDPLGHAHIKKPKFEIRLMDQNGVLLPDTCAYYQVTAGPETDNWVHNGTVRYQPWSQVTVDLSQYIGQHITVQFKTEDCGLYGHFGYAYLDARCAPNQIQIDNFCSSLDTITLNAPSGYISYDWIPYGDTTQSITIPAPADGDTIVVVMRNIAGCINTVSRIIHLLPQPLPSISPGDTICMQDTAILWAGGAGAGGLYQWYSDPPGFSSNDDTITVSPSQTTSYYVIVENANGCVADSVPLATVVVDSVMYFSLPSDLEICLFDTLTLLSPFPADDSIWWYSWPPGFSSGEHEISVSPSGNISYILYAEGMACSFRDTMFVSIYDYLYDNPITQVQICSGTYSVTLDAPNYAIDPYWLETGDSSASITILNPVAYMIYSVSMMTPAGCPDTLRFILDYLPDPEADAGEDTIICEGLGAQLGATGGQGNSATYSWTSIPPGFTANTQNIVVAPTVTTDYIVAVTNGPDCPAPPSFDTIRVTVVESPEFDLGPDLQICKGDSVLMQLGLPEGFNYWTSDPEGFYSTDSILFLRPDTTTTYFLTINTSSCTFSDFFTIEVFYNDANNDSLSINYCPADTTVELEAPMGYEHYYWTQSGDTNRIIQYIPTGNDTVLYVLMYDAMQICKDSCVLSVHAFVPSYFPEISATDTSVCDRDSVTLSVNFEMGISYHWTSLPDSLNDSLHYMVTVVPLDTVWYICETMESNCPLRDSIMIVAHDVPEAILPEDRIICLGDVLYHIVQPVDGIISWSNESGNFSSCDSVLALQPLSDETYYLEVSTPWCSSVDTLNIQVMEGEMLPDTLRFHYCFGDSILLLEGPDHYVYYYWPDNSGSGQQLSYPCITGDSTFLLLMLDSLNPCFDSCVVEIIENYLSTPIVYSSAVRICEGESIHLSVSADSMSALAWYEVGGNLLDTDVEWIDVFPEGSSSYCCVSSFSNCVHADTISIQVDSLPIFDFGEPVRICPGDHYFIDPQVQAQHFMWMDMDTVVPRLVTLEGSYALTAINGNCDWSDTLEISYITDSGFRIPNVFTPNGDGYNDRLEILIEDPEGFYIKLFNRWGNILFESDNPYVTWDGRTGSGPVASGVYFYTCRYKSACSGILTELEGTVHVLR